jgi:5-methyltetrahydrofolate--homocysteine methyltransferase
MTTSFPVPLPPLDDHPFFAAMRDGVIVFDGGMGTSLQNYALTADDFGGPSLEGCNEVLVATRPDVVEEIHRAFLDAGVHALQTNSFGGAPWVLAEYDLEPRTEELNRLSAECARRAIADANLDGHRFVVGSIGPGTRSPSLSLGKDPATTADFIDVPAMEEGYRRQIRGLLDGGCDVLLIETVYDVLQAKAAVAAANDVFVERGERVPLMVQFTVEKDLNTMLLGTEPLAALAALDPLAIDVLGLNCATGPEDMREHVRTLAHHSRLPISVIPNAGIPHLEDGQTVYPLDPAGLAQATAEFVREFGVRIVGGCCGTTPEHLAAVVAAVTPLTPRPRAVDRPTAHRKGAAGSFTAPALSGEANAIAVEWRPSLASLYAAVPIEQENTFLAIGERANANGSRAFRDLLLAEDWDATVQLARSQTREGAHVLDVCVDYVGRDGAKDIIPVVDRFATQSTLPLVIDSTEVAVIEAALMRIGGRAVINSVNLEDGRGKAERLFALARRYGAAVIALAIDETGQARDTAWKVAVCEQIAAIGIDEFGLEAHDLIFDCLTFPLGSGQDDLRNDAIATLDAIETVKKVIPGCATTLGVSNVSFGLSTHARHVLNSVFLDEAVKRGLDSAIVHSGKIVPLHRIPDDERQLAQDLVYNRRGDDPNHDPLTAFMAAFDGVQDTVSSRDERQSLPVNERLSLRIIDGDRDDIEVDLDEALAEHPPLTIINDFLLAGMAEVGELFASGQMQLPFVLRSAEAMKTAVSYLEPFIQASGESTSAKGRVLLATVKGDVHDIGKNLVDIILRNNGYEVVNLGIKQPIDAILTAAEENNCDAIGMSGLLVKSTVVMRENLEEMNLRGLAKYPVLLGGAALTRGYVEDDLRAMYEGDVFYCKDAFEGLRVLDEVMAARREGTEVTAAKRKERRQFEKVERTETAPVTDAKGRPRSAVATDVPIPVAPFYGERVVRGIALEDVAPLLNEVALFRNQWGFTPGERNPADYQAFLDETARPVLREWLERARTEHALTPEVVYGYYPANSDGDDLIVWEPDAPLEKERVRFTFPRQDRGRFLCIADFFRPVDSGVVDLLATQVVTVGRRISDIAKTLFDDDLYTDYLFAHGFGVEMAEALAELWHRRVRQELNIAGDDGPTVSDWFRQGYQGSRYSFGYAACPDLEDQEKLFKLIDPSKIGVALTDEFMLDPEQSTSAIIVHHPEAKYFNAR